MSFVGDFLAETGMILHRLDIGAIEALVDLLVEAKHEGHDVFVLGLGGSAANASHLAADLRLRADIAACAPESLPEVLAWINDWGWERWALHWLEKRRFTFDDMVLVLSVGGGDDPPGVSLPLVRALEYAQSVGAPTAAIVGEPGGYAGEHADVVVKIPTVAPDRKTEHCEGWQGIIHHLLVAHPRLKR